MAYIIYEDAKFRDLMDNLPGITPVFISTDKLNEALGRKPKTVPVEPINKEVSNVV